MINLNDNEEIICLIIITIQNHCKNNPMTLVVYFIIKYIMSEKENYSNVICI